MATSKRDEILDIAKLQFARQGYIGTSMRHIAEESGLLAGSLYSHFRSKTEMVGDIVNGFYSRLIPRQEEALEVEGSGLDQLTQMIRNVVEVCAEHPHELIIVHYDWNVLSNLDGLEDFRGESLRTLELWSTVIESAKSDGSVSPGVDTDAVVRIITSSIHALVDTVRYSDIPLQVKGAELSATIESVLIHGIANSGKQAVRTDATVATT